MKNQEDSPTIRQIIPADGWYAAYWDEEEDEIIEKKIMCFALFADDCGKYPTHKDAISGCIPYNSVRNPEFHKGSFFLCHKWYGDQYLGMFHENNRENQFRQFNLMIEHRKMLRRIQDERKKKDKLYDSDRSGS